MKLTKENKYIESMNLESFVFGENVDTDKFKLAVIGAGQAGCNIATQFIKIGHYGVLLNTSATDLEDAVSEIEKLEKGKDFKAIKLKGYDGAAKNRAVGAQAIRDNAQLLTKELISDSKLVEADFVIIISSLGGGTGTGSISLVASILAKMRENKRINVIKDPRTRKIISKGKPTISVITACPEEDSNPNIKINAAETLGELEVLQEKLMLGSNLLIDNEKLINDFIHKSDEQTKGKSWITYGNMTTATTMSEITFLTNLLSKENFDKAEAIDILATPGYLTLGKTKLDKKWMENFKNKVTVDKKEDTSPEEKMIHSIIKNSFSQQNIFAEDYDYEYVTHGGLVILCDHDQEIMNSRKSLIAKRELKKILKSPIMAPPHFGVYEGVLDENEKDAVIYTLAVIKKLPKRIYEDTIKAHKELETKKQSLEQHQKEDFKLRDIVKKDNNEVIEDTMEEISFDDIFAGSLLEGEEEKNKNEEVDIQETGIYEDLYNLNKKDDE